MNSWIASIIINQCPFPVLGRHTHLVLTTSLFSGEGEATATEGLFRVLMQQRSLMAIRMIPTKMRTGPVILSCVVLKPCCSPMPMKTKVVPMHMRARPIYKNISTLHSSLRLSTFIIWNVLVNIKRKSKTGAQQETFLNVKGPLDFLEQQKPFITNLKITYLLMFTWTKFCFSGCVRTSRGSGKSDS